MAESERTFLQDLMQPSFLWMVAASALAGAIWAKRLDDRVTYLEAFTAQITSLRAQSEAQVAAAAAMNAQLVAIHDAMVQADRREGEILEDMRALDQRMQTQFNALLPHMTVAP